jgi:hypothetical protein
MRFVNFILECAPQVFSRQGGGVLRWQDNVSNYNANPPPIQVLGDGVPPGLPAGVKSQMKNRVKLIEQSSVDVQSFGVELEFLDEATALGINSIRLGDARIEGILRG